MPKPRLIIEDEYGEETVYELKQSVDEAIQLCEDVERHNSEEDYQCDQPKEEFAATTKRTESLTKTETRAG